MKSTIRSSEEISFYFNNGKRFSNQFITVLVVEPEKQHDYECSHGRVAFIAGKKCGNAVWRNAAKRRLRALYQDSSELLSSGNVVMIARSSLLRHSYQEVFQVCSHTFNKVNSFLASHEIC